MKIALIGSVSSTLCTLETLIETGVDVCCCLGVDESLQSKISDFRTLRPVAERAGIPFVSFRKVSEPLVAETLRQHAPDLLFVIGLSQLVPESLTSICSHGGVGFHPTMLPEGRGRAPVAWTILLNRRAAANLFFLTDEPDAGDIIIQREVAVLPDDYSEDLIRRTNEALCAAILEIAPALKSGQIPRTPQDHSLATYYEKRTPADGLIDWSLASDDIYRLIRAAGRPYPGAFTFLNAAKIIIWRARPRNFAGELPPPGSVLVRDGTLLVSSRDGLLEISEFESAGNEATLLPGAVLSASPISTDPS